MRADPIQLSKSTPSWPTLREVSLDSSPLQIIHYKYVLVQNNGEPVWEPRLNRSLESNDRELDDGEFGEDSAGSPPWESTRFFESYSYTAPRTLKKKTAAQLR